MDYARLAEGPSDAVAAALSGRARGVIAPTSGSTGEPRGVMVSTRALVASAEATEARMGGAGAWLLAVPATRIAGAMVLVRAALAGTPVASIPPGSFTASAFAEAAAAMPAGRRYVSLVPTQVRRLLADAAGTAALASFDRVLVGGAAPGMELPPQASETYGMTETCGGCVYDGRPLDGVRMRTDGTGRIHLSGPMLADGYVDGDHQSFVEWEGERWLRTDDVGRIDGGVLTVLGRADDAIVTGGVTVHPAPVERALLRHPAVADAAVVGVADREWGQRVAAVVELAAGATVTLGELRAAGGAERYALPTRLVVAESLPRTAAGKIDRSAVRALAAHASTEEAS